jgi:alternate signal-mediated exported protein
MNRLTKGAIAGAAGISLLLGGAGTFALWNANAATAAGTITAGTLSISAASGAGTWQANGSSVADIADYRIVPGDVLTFTKDVTVTATGDSLTAVLALGPGSIVAASDGAADTALADALAGSATFAASGSGITRVGSTDTYSVAAGTNGTVTITVTIAVPDSAAPATDNAWKGGAVSLTGMNVTLTQVR